MTWLDVIYQAGQVPAWTGWLGAGLMLTGPAALVWLWWTGRRSR